MRLISILIGLTWCVLSSTASGQADSGLSVQVIAQLKRSVQARLDARHRAVQRTQESFPGATTAIALPDGQMVVFSTGYSDVENKVSMNRESRMPAGSIGKTFAMALALRLVQERKLTLDGKISQWLGGESWFSRLPNAQAISLRNLLNHSSGLEDHVFGASTGFQEFASRYFRQAPSEASFDPASLVQFVLDRDPLFAAGSGFHYSDTGYILVGMIIEKIGASTYYDQLANVG